MVKQFIRYLGLVMKRSFTGLFILVDLLGVILLVLSLSQPRVPVFVSLIVFVVIFVISSFLVWVDSEHKNDQLDAQIAQIKNEIPKYQVDTGAFEKFSIAKLVDEAVTELEEVQAKLRPQQSLENSSVEPFATAFRTLSQFTFNLPRILGGESLEDKEDRMVGYLKKLEAFENKLKNTYKVPLFFESSRSDGNVEFEVEASPECEMIVEDDYVSDNLPKTHEPSLYGTHMALGHIPSGGFANKLYPYSYTKEGVGHSKLNKVNANRKYSVFDEDFYIVSTSHSVELKITIHSEKIVEPQVIKLKLDFKDVSFDEINQTDEE